MKQMATAPFCQTVSCIHALNILSIIPRCDLLNGPDFVFGPRCVNKTSNFSFCPLVVYRNSRTDQTSLKLQNIWVFYLCIC